MESTVLPVWRVRETCRTPGLWTDIGVNVYNLESTWRQMLPIMFVMVSERKREGDVVLTWVPVPAYYNWLDTDQPQLVISKNTSEIDWICFISIETLVNAVWVSTYLGTPQDLDTCSVGSSGWRGWGAGAGRAGMTDSLAPVLCADLLSRAVWAFGISGPHWKQISCLGPHIKTTNTNENKKIS